MALFSVVFRRILPLLKVRAVIASLHPGIMHLMLGSTPKCVIVQDQPEETGIGLAYEGPPFILCSARHVILELSSCRLLRARNVRPVSRLP
jgi:hypothetical protein